MPGEDTSKRLYSTAIHFQRKLQLAVDFFAVFDVDEKFRPRRSTANQS
jgi:hypothetical protein